MKTILAAGALILVAVSSAWAFDADTEALIARYKMGKPVAITDVAQLMRASEAWCYDQQETSCAWREVYLDVTEDRVVFELANAWDEQFDYAMTDEAVFAQNRICQTGFNWIPSLRATSRDDGRAIGGRALHDLRAAIAESRPDIATYDDCFDYLFMAADPEQDTVTLLQRQYVDAVHDTANDVEVTIHFNADDAAGLTLAL